MMDHLFIGRTCLPLRTTIQTWVTWMIWGWEITSLSRGVLPYFSHSRFCCYVKLICQYVPSVSFVASCGLYVVVSAFF
jgi:hypothetical protein